MKVKVNRINLVKDKKSTTRAFVTANINGVEVKDIRIVDGKKGLFVSFPQRSYEDRKETKYVNIVYIPDKDDMTDVTEAILDEYATMVIDENKHYYRKEVNGK